MDPRTINAFCPLVCLLTLVVMAAGLTSTMEIAECPDRRVPSKANEFGCRQHTVQHQYVFNCSGQGLLSIATAQRGAQVLDFSNNKIMCVPKVNNTVSTCTMHNCTDCITDLHLEKNNIVYVAEKAFTDLSCLQSLDLSRNNITAASLHQYMFDGLQNLQHLDFSGNPLGSVQQHVFDFTAMTRLATLNLSSCQVNHLDPMSINGFSSLQVFDLSNNNLTTLPYRLFEGMTSLQLLDLSRNRISTISNLTFGDLTNLTELRLNHNRLHVIGDFAFFEDMLLTRLLLHDNRFGVVPIASLRALRRLEHVDLSQNPIAILRREQYSVRVDSLSLDRLQGLATVEDGAFSAFPGLRRLSLRFCQALRTIPEGAFRGNFSQLREVRLDHNGLNSLPAGLLPWQQLSVLTLHDNPWNCDCSLQWAAGRYVANTTMRCQNPTRLQGHMLHDVNPKELSCARPLILFYVLVGLTLSALFLAVLGLVLWVYQGRMPCACLRGTKGQYVTVFTKEDTPDGGDSFTSSTSPEDLDLGTGSSRGEGRVRILTKNVRYHLLRLRQTESQQDLIQEEEDL